MSMSPIMEGERPILLDASSYMLVEASGDSESDYYNTAEAAGEEELGGAAAEDDAESCSCGSLSDSAAASEIDGGGGDDFLDEQTDFDDCVEDYGGGGWGADEVEDGVVDQYCRGGATVAEGCEDSKMKLMSERERDRLFWEACLAS